ncbi:unnamed protein product [Cylindrotheca closterium]|uniref:Uncharacterized protein n=1 Tax=Cylindrotheca closterium TaxID=2856 RepID=A0AAD2FZZ2_9STRA|nr:unnamed protein product [Cylindrotheca closterium]
MTEEEIAKKKKKKKKSIVEDGEGDENNGETIKKKKKKKLKKAASESALTADGPVKKKKKKKKKVAGDFGGDSSDDDDDFLPDSPLKDEPKKTLKRSKSLSGDSNHSADLGSIRENGAIIPRDRSSSPSGRPKMRPSGAGRGMQRAQSLNFGGRGGGMNRQGSSRNSMNGRGRGMGNRQTSRGGGLSISEHGPGRGGRGMGIRQPSRGGGLSMSEHGPGRGGRGMGMRQPSRGGGLSTSEHGRGRGGRGMGSRQSSMRQSNRFNGGLDGGSNHGGNKRVMMARQPSARVEMDGQIEEMSVGSSRPGRGRPSLADTKRSYSQASMSLSNHSLDLGDFGDEPKWKKVLRYLHIMKPTPDETPIQRKQRYLIWFALFLDFIAAMVSIFSYDGVTTCCEVPIFDTASTVLDWDVFIRTTTYIYTALLFIEILPVLKKGLPINLINPLLGFGITFGMFFDDRIFEAVAMWLIEASAIGCEVVVFLLKRKEFNEGQKRVDDATTEIESRKPKSRKSKLARGSSKTSFDDDLGLEEGANSDLRNLDNFRLERERRRLRVAQSTEEISLRYHFIGTIINCGLVVLSMSLIAGVGKNGGLCIIDLAQPPLFANDQQFRCAACFTPENENNKDFWDEDGNVCQICDTSEGGTNHVCYYSYI